MWATQPNSQFCSTKATARESVAIPDHNERHLAVLQLGVREQHQPSNENFRENGRHDLQVFSQRVGYGFDKLQAINAKCNSDTQLTQTATLAPWVQTFRQLAY